MPASYWRNLHCAAVPRRRGSAPRPIFGILRREGPPMDDRTAGDGISRTWLGKYNRPHQDLREFIERAEREGEIVRAAGADWDLEMGALAEIVNHKRPEAPAI